MVRYKQYPECYICGCTEVHRQGCLCRQRRQAWSVINVKTLLNQLVVAFPSRQGKTAFLAVGTRDVARRMWYRSLPIPVVGLLPLEARCDPPHTD